MDLNLDLLQPKSELEISFEYVRSTCPELFAHAEGDFFRSQRILAWARIFSKRREVAKRKMYITDTDNVDMELLNQHYGRT